jgi:hypothetical protein
MIQLRPPLRLASKVSKLQPVPRLLSSYLQQGLKARLRPTSVHNRAVEVAAVHVAERRPRPQSSLGQRFTVDQDLRGPRTDVITTKVPSTARERSHSSFVVRMNQLEKALEADQKYRDKLKVPEGFFSPRSSASTRAATPLTKDKAS